MQLGKVLLLVTALAAVTWLTDGRAVARDDVKGIKTLQPNEARDDPFFDPNPQYDFAYRIHDEETGDAKDQTEERRGDAVTGSYSVVDPDGTLRVVKYTADDEHGFNAVVLLTPGHSKPIVPVVRSFARVTQPTKAAAQQHHIDIPVPVQHHVLPAQQVVSKQRVQVQHPAYQSGVLMHQHVIQPPLTLGAYQDVQHLVPQNAYQLHSIHQIPGSGIHHQALPLVQDVKVQEQQRDVLALHEFPTSMMQAQDPSLLKQQGAASMARDQGAELAVQLQQDLRQGSIQQEILKHGLQQQDLQPSLLQKVFIQPDLQQSHSGDVHQQEAQQPELKLDIQQINKQNVQQGGQQEMKQYVQQGNPKQDIQEGSLQQKQDSVILPDEQDNKLQQPQMSSVLPVVQLRLAVQPGRTVQQENQELRSLEGEDQAQLHAQYEAQPTWPRLQQVHQVHHEVQRVQEEQPMQLGQQAVTHQRTLAAYRTTATATGAQGTNFITFNSPYAQYTIS